LVAVKKKTAAAGGDGLGRVEEIANGAYGALNFEPFVKWLDAYFHPYQSYEKEKKNADFGSATTTFAYIGLVNAVIAIVVMALVLALALPFVGISLTIAGAIMLLVAYPIASVIVGFMVSLLYFVIAKVVGGKGGYMEQTYAMALVSGGVTLMILPFNVLQIVPLVGGIFGLAGLAVALYGIVSQYRMIRAVHSLSQLRAIIVLLVPFLLIMAFVFLVVGAAAIAALVAYGPMMPPVQ
jgi:hypothetical protein